MIELEFQVTAQPDEISCGPACLHAVYRYYGDALPVEQVIAEAQSLEEGGTLAVMLGLHALRRGYEATIYTCDLVTFDPSWFTLPPAGMKDKLQAQAAAKDDPKIRQATDAYVSFIDRGGRIHMEDIDATLIASLLAAQTPVIAGLSATWLYRCVRERPDDLELDDVRGEPTGHFVVVHGLDLEARTATIADPYCHEPFPGSHSYTVDVDRLISAVLLGIVTFDAKMLIVRPPGAPGSSLT